MLVMTSSNYKRKNVNYVLHQLLEGESIAEASTLIESMLKDSYSYEKEYRGFVSLVIKFYIMSNDNEKLDSFYSLHLTNLMKRDILIYTHYYYSSNFDKALKNFVYLIRNYYLDSSNLLFLINNKMYKFIGLLDTLYIKLNKYDSQLPIDDYNILHKYPFNKAIINKILSQINIKKKDILISFYKNLTSIYQDKIIIDAGNILFSVGGNITILGYTLLVDLIEYYLGINMIPIIIIHNRHLKTSYKGSSKNSNIIKCIEKIKSYGSKFIFETPYNENDDFYIIYLSLLLECNVLTNDNYKDHIFNFRTNESNSDENMAQNYIDDLTVKYSINCRNLIINEIDSLEFSKCIQIIDKDVYIPTIDNTFIKLSLNLLPSK